MNKIKKAPMVTIIEKDAIRKALHYGTGIPDSILPDKLEPMAMAKFKGDGALAKHNPNWSINDKFTIGTYYPIYPTPDNDDWFAIGNDGKGYKGAPVAWGKLYQVEH